MNNAAVVSMCEPGRDVRSDPLDLGIRRPGPCGETVLEGAAGKILEDHVRPTALLAVVEEAHDVRVCKPGSGLRFPFEPGPIGLGSE